jgi:hypothetical protein
MTTSDGLSRLASSSPAIHSADSKIDSWVKDDIFGRPRVNFDMGVKNILPRMISVNLLLLVMLDRSLEEGFTSKIIDFTF